MNLMVQHTLPPTADTADPRSLPDLFSGSLRPAMVAAGRRALEYQGQMLPECKSDGTLVTPADQTIESDLRQVLLANDPGCQVLGEEAMAAAGPADAGRFDFSRRTWVIDPIDGTALYAYRMPGWGVSLGLMEQGALADGLVLFPSAIPGPSSLLLGGCGQGVVKTWLDLRTGTATTEAPVAGGSLPGWSPHSGFLPRYPEIQGFPGLLGISQTLAKNALYDGPHTILNTASCVNSFLHLMAGSLVGYCARVKLWDLAAVWPLAWRLGIRACDIHGNAMGLDLDPAIWHLDPQAKTFLAQKSHILYYHPDLLEPAKFWRDLHWRDGRLF